MSIIQHELEDFSKFSKERLEKGETDRSLDELFDLWRSENPSDQLSAENIAAVNESIQDFKAGERGTVVGQHSNELRNEFGITNE